MQIRFIMAILLAVMVLPVMALDNDREQPATLDADDFEMDFNTGVRIYRGDVVFTQGSIRLNCDELTTYLNSNDELDKAICVGNPGRFKQRPEGQEEDVVGTAMEITMDQTEDIVTLKTLAKVVQGDKTITGKVITYDMTTEKVRVKGGGQAQQAASSASSDSEESSAEGSATEGSLQPEESDGNDRPRIVIQPRKKETDTVEEGAEDDSTESSEEDETDSSSESSAE